MILPTMPIEIQQELVQDDIPPEEILIGAAKAALDHPEDSAAVCIRIVDEAEGRALNYRWRGKDYATNVLSFPAEPPPGLPADQVPAVLGDLVLCAPVIAREAALQHKPQANHWVHLVVHGVLHLRGLDHVHADHAARMERLECEILAGLGVPDPYQETDSPVAG